MAYSEFQTSGKVYMDGILIDSSSYETKEGSTIILFTKTYTDLLKTGNHTIKVTTDNGEATTEFTVKKSEKEENPKTGDMVIKYMIFTVISITLAILLTIKRKKIFKF